MIIHSVMYITIIFSLIWGRFYFFKINGTSGFIAMLYDSAVTAQIVLTIYSMLTTEHVPVIFISVSTFVYFLSLSMFWWAVVTARSLDFAFSESVGDIVTTGPFKIVRHPFYTSYILVWFSSTLLFNSPYLWITLIFLVAFYYLSARKEEKVILKSAYSEEYEKYIQQVGMFLPRIKKWVPSSSEL